MVDHGKRSRSGRDRGRDRGRDANDDRKSQKRRLQNTSSNRNNSNMGNSSEGELVVYRILCPSEHIGSVIGKGGKVINSLRQETNAKIKVVDPYPGCTNRVMMIYCYVHNKDGMDVDENNMKPICASQDALLKVHATIINSVAGFGDSEKKNTVEAKVLAPASQASSIIGKAGCSIKKIRANTNASIKINPKDISDPLQFCLMNFDNLITITGNVEAVKRALFLISTIMYKTPPREEISLETTVPELQGSIIIPSDVPFFPTADGFYPGVEGIGSSSRSVAPITDFAGYADPSVAWAPPYPSAMPGVSEFSTPNANELVVRLLCPSDKIGRVIGKGGSSITHMRKVTGARIDVDDRKNNTDECIITITSTESMNDVKSASIEAIWLLQEKINEDDGERVNMRFLVPSKIIGCVIGKGGSIINEIRKATKTEIRISKGDKPKCASSNEELVEIFGELSCLRNAILQIILRLRDDVLRNRENKDASSWNPPPPPVPMYSSSHSLPPVLTSVPPASSLSYDKRTESGNGIGMFKSAGSHYEYNSLQNEDSKYRSQSSNAFLYMINTYIIVPTADDYATSLGAAATTCGIIIGSMAVAQIFSSVYFSAWSNKSYFHPLVFSSMTLLFGNVLYAFAYDANSITLLLMGRLLCGLGSARAVNRRYISDCVPLKQRMQASAGFVSASALGMACGPALAGLLQADFKIHFISINSNTLPGWVMGLAWLVYLPCLWIFFKEPERDTEEKYFAEGDAENGFAQPLLLNLVEEKIGEKDEDRDCDESEESVEDSHGPVNSIASAYGLLTPSVKVQLLIYFMLKFAMEILLSASSVISTFYFDWTVSNIAVFLALLGLTVLPVNILVGSCISNIFKERQILLVSEIIVLIGILLSFNVISSYTVWQYVISALITFVAAQVLEGVNLSLLSHTMSCRLSKGTYNGGLLSTEAGTLARVAADVTITLTGYLGVAMLLNITLIPSLALCVVSIVATCFIYNSLY